MVNSTVSQTHWYRMATARRPRLIIVGLARKPSGPYGHTTSTPNLSRSMSASVTPTRNDESMLAVGRVSDRFTATRPSRAPSTTVPVHLLRWP